MSTRPHNRLGRYELIREVARSNDVVYEAWDPDTQRRVALKALNIPDGASAAQKEDRTRRFEREARAAARLHHANIVTLFDFGTDQEQPFLVFEFVEGPTLADNLLTNGPFDPGKATHFALQLLAAVAYAHSQGVIHRDIKPSNIFVCRGDRLKITDLGIARIEAEASVTTDGQIFGTPAYMAPEQVRGQEIDQRADLWAVGVVLYQMLTGVQPFTGGSVLEIGSSVLTKEPDLAMILDDRLRYIVSKALAKDVAFRFLTAAEMSKALEGPALTQGPIPVSMPPPIPAGQPTLIAAPASVFSKPKRNALPWVATAVGALALGSGIAFLQSRHDPPNQRQGPETTVVQRPPKSMDEVFMEAWEHHSLHELAATYQFELLPRGAEIDQLDTWCRTTIGPDYLLLDQPTRTLLLDRILDRFSPIVMRRRSSLTAQLAANSAARAFSDLNHPMLPNPTVMGPGMPSKAQLDAMRPVQPPPASESAPEPVAAGGTPTIESEPFRAPPIAAPPATTIHETPRAEQPREIAGPKTWPLQHALYFDDKAVLRRLHFEATNMRLLPGGTREYGGPDGVVRIR